VRLFAWTRRRLAYYERDLYPEAEAAYKEAIRVDPKYASARWNLYRLRLREGRFESASNILSEVEEGEIALAHPCISFDSRVQLCRTLLSLGTRLPGLLAGDSVEASALERTYAARLCYSTKRSVTAVRLFKASFEQDPTLVHDLRAGHLYLAACSAAMAGTGEDPESTKLDASRRSQYREQAREWMRDAVSDLVRRMDSPGPKDGVDALAALRHLRYDQDLAGLFQPDRIRSLPAEEQKTGGALVAELDQLIVRTTSK
jgi:tetratricopeptide (TPR) repeat protein